MLRILKKIILCGCCGLLFPSLAKADINVAIIAPLAGDYEHLGKELVSGARIAVNEINHDGGLNGEKINLVVVDDQCNDTLAVSTAQMMAVNSSSKDKMNLVVGPYCQNALKQVADIYANAKILQIVPTSVSAYELVEKPSSTIALVGNSEQQSLAFFKYYLKNFDMQKMALVYNGANKEIVGVASALQEEFLKSGKMLDFKSFNFTAYDGDYDQLAEDVLKEKTKVVLILGNRREVTKLAKELKSEDKNLAIFVNRYQIEGYYGEKMGKYADGTYFLSLPTLKENTEFTETLVKLRLLGIEPQGVSVYSYSAVKLWADMVEKADSYLFDKLASVSKNMTVNTAWGEETFVNGMPENPVNYSIYKLNNGEYAQVY